MHATKRALNQKRVLVVDDDLDSREALGALLLQAGMTVALAESEFDGLKLARDFAPTVVISTLFDQQSFEFPRQLRHQRSIDNRVLFFALTTLPDPEVRAKALSAGFNACLVKPVPPRVLLSAIAQTTR